MRPSFVQKRSRWCIPADMTDWQVCTQRTVIRILLYGTWPSYFVELIVGYCRLQQHWCIMEYWHHTGRKTNHWWIWPIWRAHCAASNHKSHSVGRWRVRPHTQGQLRKHTLGRIHSGRGDAGRLASMGPDPGASTIGGGYRPSFAGRCNGLPHKPTKPLLTDDSPHPLTQRTVPSGAPPPVATDATGSGLDALFSQPPTTTASIIVSPANEASAARRRDGWWRCGFTV